MEKSSVALDEPEATIVAEKPKLSPSQRKLNDMNELFARTDTAQLLSFFEHLHEKGKEKTPNNQ